MAYRRCLALCGILFSLLLVSACVDGTSPSDPSSGTTAFVALNATFPAGTTSAQLAPISLVRVTVLRVANDGVIGSFTTEVNPNDEVWTISIEVQIPPDNPQVYLVTELISVVDGIQTVEFSGVTRDFSLGRNTPVQQVTVVQGPVANNFVTSVTLQPAGPLTEGDGLQMRAQVELSRPGAATVLWTSSDPAIASVTQQGFLQAHLPGAVDVVATAGGRSATAKVAVLARPIGLRFASQPGTVEIGETMSPAPSVEIVDTRGERVTHYSGPIELELQDRSAAAAPAPAEGTSRTVAAPQSAPLNGTTTVVAANGLAVFDDLVVPQGGLFRLLATAQGLNPATSEEFSIALPLAELAITKEVDKPTAKEGELVTFLVRVTNLGPETATGVSVFDQLPNGLTVQSVTASQGTYTVESLWEVGSLKMGESATLTMGATINAGTAGGHALVNEARILTLRDQADDPANNEATASVEVGRRVANLRVSKSANKTDVREKKEVVFTVSVLNAGPDRAENVSLFDRLPSGLTLVSARPDVGRYSPASGEWAIGGLAPGAQVRMFVTALVEKGRADQSITNVAAVPESANREDDLSDNTASATIRALPELTDPEDHAFKTAGNTALLGGGFPEVDEGYPAPPMLSPFPEIAAAQVGSLIQNTPELRIAEVPSGPTEKGGTVSIDEMGRFLYVPPIGFQGTDSFFYTTTSGLTAKVTIQVIEMIWYVNNTAEDGSGGSLDPFPSLLEAESASGPDEAIFVFYGDGTSYNQNSGITLKTNQILVGSGIELDVPGIGPVYPATAPPKISNAGGYGVVLADNSEVGGIHIDNTGGRGISAEGVDGSMVFDVLITDSGDHSVKLRNSTGTFDFHDVEIRDSNGSGFKISDGDPSVNFGGSITGSSEWAIDIARTTGGNANFSGDIQSPSGSSGAVRLSEVDGDVRVEGVDALSGSSAGVDIFDSDGTLTFDKLGITGVVGDAFAVDGGAATIVVHVDDIDIQNDINNAVIVENTTGGSVTFNGNTISDTDGRGITVDNNVGSVTFNSLVTALDPIGDGAPPFGAPPEVESVDDQGYIEGTPDGLIHITDNAGAVTFQDLEVTSNDGTVGVVVSNNTDPVSIFGGFVDADGGSALFVHGSSANITFQTIDVDNSSNGGIDLANNTGTFTFLDVDIAFSDGVGIDLDDTGAVNVGGPTSQITTIGTVGTREAIHAFDTQLGMEFASVTCNTCNVGISLEDTGGSLLIDGGAISSTTVAGIDIDGSSGNFRFDGTILNASGNSVVVSSYSSGTAQFGGAIDDSGDGINLDDNSGSIRFDGGLNLHTGAATAFTSSNGGTLHITGTNTVNNTTGVGIDISNTTIGLGGATFQSVSTNGAPSGIKLDGLSGAIFQVTGIGSSGGSGGLIQNSTGAGVSILNSQNVNLNNLEVTDSSGNGITIDGSGGLSFDNIFVSGNGTNGIDLLNPDGHVQISGSTVEENFTSNIRSDAAIGTGSLTVSNSIISQNYACSGDAGIDIDTSGTANFTATFTGNTISDHQGTGLDAYADGSSTLGVTVSGGNAFTNNWGGIGIASGGTSMVTFSISGNSFQNEHGRGIGIYGMTGAAAGSSFSGQISGENDFDDINSGSAIHIDNAGAGVGTVLVDNNNVLNVPLGNALFAQVGSGSAPTGTLNLSVSNNVFDVNDDNNDVDISATESSTQCLFMDNNQTATSIVYGQKMTSAASVVGLGAAATPGSESTVESVLSSSNLGASVSVTIATSVLPAVSCPTP